MTGNVYFRFGEMNYYMPYTASKDSIYKFMEYQEYEFYEDWKAFTRIHKFNMGTYYSLRDKLISGSLVDFAYEQGIKAVQVNLYNFIPGQGLIIDSCLRHLPVFHWASEHAGYNLLRIQHLKTEELLCNGDSNGYACSDANSYSYFSFSFFVQNTGLMTSPNGSFDFYLEYEQSSEYAFNVMKLRHTIKTLRRSNLEEITSDLGAELSNQLGNSSVNYQHYELDPRKRYEITVYVERSKPENSVSSVALKFTGSFILDPAKNDDDLRLIVNEVKGRLLVEPEVTAHTELIIGNEYTDGDYTGPGTDPDDFSSDDLDEMIENHAEDDDESSDSNRKEVILGVVISVIIIVGIIIIAFFFYVCRKKKQTNQNLGSNNPVYLAPQENPQFAPIDQPNFISEGPLGSNEPLDPVTMHKAFEGIELGTPSRI